MEYQNLEIKIDELLNKCWMVRDNSKDRMNLLSECILEYSVIVSKYIELSKIENGDNFFESIRIAKKQAMNNDYKDALLCITSNISAIRKDILNK